MSNSVKILASFSLVIQRSAFDRSFLNQEKIDALRNKIGLYDFNDDLESWGPFFGGESLEYVITALQSLGLVYYDDFFEICLDFPHWINLTVSIKN